MLFFITIFNPIPKKYQFEFLFQVEFNKHYNSIEESEKRFNIFKRNVRDIDEHNRLYEEGKSTYMMGINQFTDWTNEEYQEWVRTH